MLTHFTRIVSLLSLLTTLHAAAQVGDVEPNTTRLGLRGYSPVSYFEHDKPHFGSPQHQATFDGVTYLLASDEELDKFKANPRKYAPAYGGWCAYGMAVNGKFDADPTNYEIVDGRLHVFLRNADVDTRKLWNDGDEAALGRKADAFWNTLHSRASRAYLRSHNLSAGGIAIDGYSPVSYFTRGQAELGSAEFAVEHESITYLLTSQKQVELFKANPDKYAPAYGGWCAFGMAVSDKFPIDPTAFKIVNGRLMLFLRNTDIDARDLWNKGDEVDLLRKAEAHWTKVSK